MTVNNNNTYWNGKGKHQAAADALQKLIPVEGAVPNARTKNAKLEKFRKAVNCYYDYYNNGLWNRAAEFRGVFGFPGRNQPDAVVEPKLEAAMDAIVVAAAAEQNIAIEDTSFVELAAK